jgi:hypothetical protein
MLTIIGVFRFFAPLFAGFPALLWHAASGECMRYRRLMQGESMHLARELRAPSR